MDLEVLAPVGSREGIKVAINAGANAVYFGLPKFNARAKAENITIENLKEVVDTCHLFNVKVYVTINTIIKDEEVKDFLSLVECAVNAKVDAFIIQDFGMAYLLKNTFKNIVLHASTQMGIHNLLGAKMLEEMGITRVVLSRETKLQDIIEIKNKTNLEIEYFVQGALCVAFSGNCYLSSLNNSKSGNRGECLQLCRLKYTALENNKQIDDGYLLSPTDLCLLNNLKTLIDAGVTSFKIEGRLRRFGYIAESVKEYVNAINNLENYNLKQSETKLKKVFNRGEYNKGYYLTENNNEKIINKNFQNHRGVLVGKVKEVKPFKDLYQIVLSSNHKLHTNDGLKFVNGLNEISLGVGNVIELKNNEYKIFSKQKPNVLDDVYLTVDSVHENELINEKKLLNVNVFVELEKYQLPHIKLSYKNVEVEIFGDDVLEPAKNAPISVPNVIECFNKVDEYPFNVKTVCALGGVFIPKSVLNDLRRRAYLELKNKIILDYENKNIKKVTKVEFDEPKVVDNNNYSLIICDKYEDSVNNFDKVVFSPKEFNVSVVEEFYSKYKNKFYLNLPIICNGLDYKKLEEIFKVFTPDKMGIMANNLYALGLNKFGYEVIGGYPLNIANSYSIMFLNSLNVTTFIKTVEPTLNSTFNYGLNYLGNIALMTFCHCPYKTTFGYSNCSYCKYTNKLTYVDAIGNEYKIIRYIVDGCYFELKQNKKIDNFKPVVGCALDIRS